MSVFVPISYTEICHDLVLMSLPWTILEYALNQTWDYAIYHLTFSHKNLMCYHQQNYICQILRQSVSFMKMLNNIELMLAVPYKLYPTSHWSWNQFLSFVSDYPGNLLKNETNFIKTVYSNLAIRKSWGIQS